MLIIKQKINFLGSSRKVTKRPTIADIFSMGFLWKKLYVSNYLLLLIGNDTTHFGSKIFSFYITVIQKPRLKFFHKIKTYKL